MPTAPIGTWTLQKVQDRIMSRIGVTDPDTQVITKIRNEINFQISELYLKNTSNDIEAYVIEVPIVFINNLFDMKSINDYRDFRSLREKSFGDIVSVPTDKLEKLFHTSYFDDNFMCGNYGDNLKLFVGANLSTSGRTFFFKYLRLPIPLLIPTDFLDLLDSYVEGLINTVIAVFSKPMNKPDKVKS